jgi:predicted PurR-regulated permease PerM
MINLYTRHQRSVLQITILLILTFFIFFGLRAYLPALIGSGILYVIFYKHFNRYVHEKKRNRYLVTIVILLVSFLIIILPFLILSLMLTNQVVYYIQHVEELTPIIDKIESWTGLKLSDGELLRTIARQGGGFLSELFPTVFSGAIDILVSLGLMYFILFYMFINQETFIDSMYKYLPFRDETVDLFGAELENVVNSNVIGQSIVSLVQGACMTLGFVLFEVPNPLFWGTVSFFLSFVPVLGTPLIWVPAGILLIAQGKTGYGTGLLLYGAVLVVNIDNVLRFALAKRLGDIHPLLTILGIILGVPIFGIVGLFIGPVVLVYFMLLVQVYLKEYGSGTARRQEVEPISADLSATEVKEEISTKQELES